MNNNKKTLSIITATFNKRIKLEKSLCSVRSQTFKDLEHIIVDNLSNDGTDILVKKYIKEADYPVVYIREKDNGVYEAINKGLKVSKGSWIHTLHADDIYFDKNALKNIFKGKTEDYDILANSIILKKIGINDKLWHPAFEKRLKHYNFPHTGTIIKKIFYDKYGYYKDNYKIISDAIHQIETYNFAKYKLIKKPLIIMSSGGISSVMNRTHLKERFILIFQYHKFSLSLKWRIFMGDLFKYIIYLFKNES